jgi:hypothetical protein
MIGLHVAVQMVRSKYMIDVWSVTEPDEESYNNRAIYHNTWTQDLQREENDITT